MSIPNTFSKNSLLNNIYPLTYNVKTDYDVDILYFTVVSLDDLYTLIRDRANGYLYILNVEHDMVKDGLYITLKEILENNRVKPGFVYEDDIAVIKKEDFGKFLTFPQHGFEMFDHERIMDENEFGQFHKTASGRLENYGPFIGIRNRLPKYYIRCHDDSLLYCETRDIDLKYELLKLMLHDFFEAYINKNHKTDPDILNVPQELAEEMFSKWKKLTLREEGTKLKDGNISSLIFDAEDRESGMLVYKVDKKEWVIKDMRD
jgi:hypothetical protein